jgi:hypothetical protein
LVFYAGCLAAATYPMVRRVASAVPRDLADPLMHLWVMRWYKSALLEGHLPFLCADLQYPAGAPLGFFSPMHFQSLLYLPLSFATQNDALCYNILWILGFLLNGMGTFVLGWYLLRNGPAAWFGGLVSMLSGTMTLHAIGHLELLYVGWFPLFLVAWMRFVDRPSGARLIASASLFVLIAMGAAYFMAQAMVPAAFYMAWFVAAARGKRLAAVRARVPWLVFFGFLTAPALAVLFAGPIWALWHGHAMARPTSHFNTYSAPLWTYLTPTRFHLLGKLLPWDVYLHAGHAWKMTESVSYLGIATLGLVHYAAVRRAGFRHARFCWAALGLMIVLALGAALVIGSVRITLPAAWLRTWVPIFRLTRNPSRFNMYATVFAGVIAAAGLRELLGRLRTRPARVAWLIGLTAVAVADLRVDLYQGARIPAVPPAYAWLKERAPRAKLLEIPVQNSGSGSTVTSSCGYWQSMHGLATSAGYSGVDNLRFDNLLYHNCPFTTPRLADPSFLADPQAVPLGVLGEAPFDDYIWLLAKTQGFTHLVLHQGPGAFPGTPEVLARLKNRLERAKVYDDGWIAIYASARLEPPSGPVLICSDGWRRHRPWEAPKVWRGREVAAVNQMGRMLLANPDPTREIVLSLDAGSFRDPREVRLLVDGREVARWSISPRDLATYATPPFHLDAGLHELRLECDGDVRVTRRRDEPAEADTRPYSLRVARVGLTALPQIAESKSTTRR